MLQIVKPIAKVLISAVPTSLFEYFVRFVKHRPYSRSLNYFIIFNKFSKTGRRFCL